MMMLLLLCARLLMVRERLQLSQNELINRMGLVGELTQARVSAYERGEREPPLMVLLQYARAANVYVEALIDDEVDLPERLPTPTKSEGVRRRQTGKRRPPA